MRAFSILLTGILLATSIVWETDLENAKRTAGKDHKLILLNFSGSDWCGPCIRLHKEIFGAAAFESFAETNLVLVNADFPRLKKNQLSKDQQKKNDKLADLYNPQGNFPYTVLLDAEGKVIKAWDGFPNLTAEQFTGQIKEMVNARK